MKITKHGHEDHEDKLNINLQWTGKSSVASIHLLQFHPKRSAVTCKCMVQVLHLEVNCISASQCKLYGLNEVNSGIQIQLLAMLCSLNLFHH